MSSHRRIAALLSVMLLAAACADGAAPPETGVTEASGDHDHGDHAHADEDAAVPAGAGVVPSREGLGVAALGQDADEALAALEAAMGRPNTVTRWLPPEHSLWGRCPGKRVRGAKWGDLWVLFGEDTPLGEGRYLFGWMLGQAGVSGATGLRTAEGIGIGSTVAELRAAYGDRLELAPYELGARFTVSAEGGQPATAEFGGVAAGTGDADPVRTLRGGLPCSAQ